MYKNNDDMEQAQRELAKTFRKQNEHSEGLRKLFGSKTSTARACENFSEVKQAQREFAKTFRKQNEHSESLRKLFGSKTSTARAS